MNIRNISWRKVVPYGLIALSLSLFLITYRLGVIYTDDGCGSCFGGQAVQEYRLIIRGLPHISHPSRDACAIRGCTIPTRPFFIDLYSVGLTLLVLGIYIILRARYNGKFVHEHDFVATESVYSIGGPPPGQSTPPTSDTPTPSS